MNLNPNKDVFGADVPIWERGQMGGRTRPINQNTLFSITKEVANVFTKLGIKYCLSHGTILGVHRDGDTIPWDDDVDLAIFADDRPKLAEARTQLRGMGFYVPDEGDPNKPIDPKSNMPYYDFVALKDGEKVECWIFDKAGKFYVYDPKREGLAIPEEHFNSFSRIAWRNSEFNAPNNVEGFLTKMYGPNWKIPDPNKKYNPLRAK
jgi:hypothetical protein